MPLRKTIWKYARLSAYLNNYPASLWLQAFHPSFTCGQWTQLWKALPSDVVWRHAVQVFSVEDHLFIFQLNESHGHAKSENSCGGETVCTWVMALTPPARPADSPRWVGPHPASFRFAWVSPEGEGSPWCQGRCRSRSGWCCRMVRVELSPLRTHNSMTNSAHHKQNW